MPAGRPTDYTSEIAERICEWISEGNSLRSFCRQENTPNVSTVTRWIVRHEKFRAQYVQAREAAGYAHADNIIEVVRMLAEGETDASTAKAMMDGLKWSAERMAPKSHMPKSLVNHESPDGTMSPKDPLDLTKLPAEALEAIVKVADGQSDD